MRDKDGSSASWWRGIPDRPLLPDRECGEGGVWDALLGQNLHTAAEHACAQTLSEVSADLPAVARAEASYLLSALREMLRLGVRQLIVLNAGRLVRDSVLPTLIRHSDSPVRLVTVDSDVVAFDVARQAHSNDTVVDATSGQGTDCGGRVGVRAQAVHADFLICDQMWRSVLATGLIDPDEPVGVLMVGLHHVADTSHPEAPIAWLRGRLAAGSLLALSHAIADPTALTRDQALQDVCARHGVDFHPRRPDHIARFLGDWEQCQPAARLSDPGLTDVPGLWTGMARKAQPSVPHAEREPGSE